MNKQDFPVNKYGESLTESYNEVIELACKSMQLGDYKKAEQIVREGFYAIAFEDYQRSMCVYRQLKSSAEKNQWETIEKSLPGTLKLIEAKQKDLCNFDQEISPLILKIRSEGQKIKWHI